MPKILTLTNVSMNRSGYASRPGLVKNREVTFRTFEVAAVQSMHESWSWSSESDNNVKRYKKQEGRVDGDDCATITFRSGKVIYVLGSRKEITALIFKDQAYRFESGLNPAFRG